MCSDSSPPQQGFLYEFLYKIVSTYPNIIFIAQFELQPDLSNYGRGNVQQHF